MTRRGDASPVLQWECYVLPCAQMRYEGVVLEHEADMPAAEARPVGVVPRGAVPPVIGERSVIVVVEQPDDGGELVLPDPDFPMMAVDVPLSNDALTSSTVVRRSPSGSRTSALRCSNRMSVLMIALPV